MSEDIVVQPGDLYFPAPLHTRRITNVVRFTNRSASVYTFYIRALEPIHYQVRPRMGLIQASSTLEVSFTMNPRSPDLVITHLREGFQIDFAEYAAGCVATPKEIKEFWSRKSGINVVVRAFLKSHFKPETIPASAQIHFDVAETTVGGGGESSPLMTGGVSTSPAVSPPTHDSLQPLPASQQPQSSSAAHEREQQQTVTAAAAAPPTTNVANQSLAALTAEVQGLRRELKHMQERVKAAEQSSAQFQRQAAALVGGTSAPTMTPTASTTHRMAVSVLVFWMIVAYLLGVLMRHFNIGFFSSSAVDPQMMCPNVANDVGAGVRP